MLTTGTSWNGFIQGLAAMRAGEARSTKWTRFEMMLIYLSTGRQCYDNRSTQRPRAARLQIAFDRQPHLPGHCRVCVEIHRQYRYGCGEDNRKQRLRARSTLRNDCDADTWTLDGSLVDVTLMAPTSGGPYPLVLYLPGLGEACDAGLSWRHAWARAGYAVLCIQPKTVGRAVLASSRARAGDFLGIARDAFSVPSLEMRTQVVRAALARLSRRGRDARFAQIDLARIGIAGVGKS